MIPYARQDITQKDIRAVKNVLKSDFLTQGPMVNRFENATRKYANSKYAVAVNSATSALHIACLALGLKQGDWVWTSPNSFVASANCAVYCGAKLDFVDIDSKTYNMSINELEKKLKKAKIKKKLPKIVIPVHFAGQPCEMFEIHKLSKKYNFKIIEDASHAIGSSYILSAHPNKNKKFTKVGSCKHSDITVFSFHPVKIITTGEGGMALTNQKYLHERMILLRSHGITREAKKMTHVPDGPWYYQQIDLGYNYRMTDIQAALGSQQIKRLDKYVSKRNLIAKRYDKAFEGLPLYKPWKSPNTHSSLHLYVITLHQKYKKKHLTIFKQMRKKGIGVNLHYIPIHLQPYYVKMGFKKRDFPVSEDYYNRAMSLPIYPSLLKKQQNFIIKSLKTFLK
jgi:UDP-4-amino-4,6-dideoxy-N-acetyl-beta-L-altrosamine transaminase